MKIPTSHTRPYRLGVCLSGGGARGFAHIGAMRALRELGLIPDIIAGVSAGSVVAAFFAAGLLNDYDNDPLLKLFSDSKFRDFAEMHVPRESFFSLDRFKKHLERILPYKNIEDLPIATVIGATDIDHGTKMAFTEGPLAERIVASCSIPIVFEPVNIDGHRYVDGGVLHNMPSWAIRHLCTHLIGINCSPMYQAPPAKNIIEIAQRSYALMSKHNVIPDLEICDIVVNLTEVADHQAFDLNSLSLLVDNGYLATIRALRKHF
ncbi:MAG: patatin-like phospholipase family protein [Muribaculaceae bacterium]|nr:patatin-like phospholipase family protein [Muribaculaceae bacterium]MDE6366166.1 patatin-like phospholipase family protein [Muribaculaceae bacterium]